MSRVSLFLMLLEGKSKGYGYDEFKREFLAKKNKTK
jgi:hypothetical protein